jgi:acyl carrier protein
MTPIPEAVRYILASITGRDADSIGEQDRLSDLGVDSLDRVLLAVLVEEKLGRALSDDTLAGIRTVADLQQRLQPEENRQ